MYLPSGKDRTGWNPGSSRAIRSGTVNCSAQSLGNVGSVRPVHKAHGTVGGTHPHRIFDGRLAFLETVCNPVVWSSFRLRKVARCSGRVLEHPAFVVPAAAAETAPFAKSSVSLPVAPGNCPR